PIPQFQAETKPFTNFSVFHDNLITRLKALSQIQLDFDRRCKEERGRSPIYRQVDRYAETTRSSVKANRQVRELKTYAETKAGWQHKFSAKEGELEAIKVLLIIFCLVHCSRSFRRQMLIWLSSWLVRN